MAGGFALAMTGALTAMLLAEFDREFAELRRMLEAVPDDQFGWRPHEKSMTLGRLASHLAHLALFPVMLANNKAEKPVDAITRTELLAAFDNSFAAGREYLAQASDEFLAQEIRVTPTITRTRAMMLRRALLSHMVHHRGQLSVYLRVLGVAVPGMYGPSADERL
jgi:uncharacterized damage-inducible protein DinB